MNIRAIVHDSDTVAGRAFDLVVLSLIIFSIIAITVETLPDLPPIARTALQISEILITILFTIEYGLRIATSPKKTNYIFSFYGVIDVIAICRSICLSESICAPSVLFGYFDFSGSLSSHGITGQWNDLGKPFCMPGKKL